MCSFQSPSLLGGAARGRGEPGLVRGQRRERGPRGAVDDLRDFEVARHLRRLAADEAEVGLDGLKALVAPRNGGQNSSAFACARRCLVSVSLTVNIVRFPSSFNVLL